MDFTAPITVWTGSTYKAYSIVDDNLALRPMQSFFVKVKKNANNVVFTPAMMRDGNSITP
jgi:hypothetical protein